MKFSLNIYGPARSEVRFVTMANLFHPRTIDESTSHDGLGAVPGIKTDQSDWDLRGHRSRVVVVDRHDLEVFSSLYDDSGTPSLQARLPVVHSEEIVRVLQNLAKQPHKLSDLEEEYFATQHWNETNSQKDGTLKRGTRYPKSIAEWVVQGPHFHVATPLNKTPNEVCESNGAYTGIDLETVSEGYMPRSNYLPACDPAEYQRRAPSWRGKPVTDYYRHVHRRQMSPTGERTFIPAILHPGPSHVNSTVSAAFEDLGLLVNVAAFVCSIPFDFLVKSTGKGDFYPAQLEMISLPDYGGLADFAARRVLLLNCVSGRYDALRQATWPEAPDSLVNLDRRTSRASRGNVPLSSDWNRRQALVELDVLASISRVYPGFPTLFWGLSVFFVGDLMGKALWKLVENAARFPRRGGRVLCVHGAVSFHRARPCGPRWLPGRGAMRHVELDRRVLGLQSTDE